MDMPRDPVLPIAEKSAPATETSTVTPLSVGAMVEPEPTEPLAFVIGLQRYPATESNKHEISPTPPKSTTEIIPSSTCAGSIAGVVNSNTVQPAVPVELSSNVGATDWVVRSTNSSSNAGPRRLKPENSGFALLKET
jgi:hypothetical protein